MKIQMFTKEHIVDSTADIMLWWIGKRREKLENQLIETMSVNPFLMPFLYEFHNSKTVDNIIEIIVASHLMTGHNTGFGKLIDEKILPNVFQTTKLDKNFRNSNPPFHHSCFDEIDHIVKRGQHHHFLSLKAGKWTIQLTMAVHLNHAFKEIISLYPSDIVVGVFYGRNDTLTDKYDILRGINRGANHDVVDLTGHVSVYAGREFWSWVNEGQNDTQDWFLEGLIKGIDESKIRYDADRLMREFKEVVKSNLDVFYDSNDKINWQELLTKVNG